MRTLSQASDGKQGQGRKLIKEISKNKGLSKNKGKGTKSSMCSLQ